MEDGEKGSSAPESSQAMRVYVGNMSWEANEDDVRSLMSKAGAVKNVDLLRRGDGKSLGSAIVTFSSKSEAEAAVRDLNDVDHMGRPVLVREDREASGGRKREERPPRERRPREERAPRDGPSGGGRGSGHRVYFGNLSWDVKWQDLKDFAREAGPVGYAKVEEEHGGRSKGFGICEFETREDADRAVRTLSEKNLMGRNVHVKHDGEPSRGRDDRGAGRGGYDRRDDRGAGRGGYDRRDDRGAGRGGFDRRDDRGAGRGGFDRAPAGGGGGRGRGARVVIENLPPGLAWQDLKDEMSKVGSCRTDVKPSGDGATGFVNFDDARSAEAAISKYNGAKFNGKPVRVRYE